MASDPFGGSRKGFGHWENKDASAAAPPANPFGASQPAAAASNPFGGASVPGAAGSSFFSSAKEEIDRDDADPAASNPFAQGFASGPAAPAASANVEAITRDTDMPEPKKADVSGLPAAGNTSSKTGGAAAAANPFGPSPSAAAPKASGHAFFTQKAGGPAAANPFSSGFDTSAPSAPSGGAAANPFQPGGAKVFQKEAISAEVEMPILPQTSDTAPRVVRETEPDWDAQAQMELEELEEDEEEEEGEYDGYEEGEEDEEYEEWEDIGEVEEEEEEEVEEEEEGAPAEPVREPWSGVVKPAASVGKPSWADVSSVPTGEVPSENVFKPKPVAGATAAATAGTTGAFTSGSSFWNSGGSTATVPQASTAGTTSESTAFSAFTPSKTGAFAPPKAAATTPATAFARPPPPAAATTAATTGGAFSFSQSAFPAPDTPGNNTTPAKQAAAGPAGTPFNFVDATPFKMPEAKTPGHGPAASVSRGGVGAAVPEAEPEVKVEEEGDEEEVVQQAAPAAAAKYTEEDLQRAEMMRKVIESIAQGEGVEEEDDDMTDESSGCGAADEAMAATILEFKAALASQREANDVRREQIERNASQLTEVYSQLSRGVRSQEDQARAQSQAQPLRMSRRHPLESLPLPASQDTRLSELKQDGLRCVEGLYSKVMSNRHTATTSKDRLSALCAAAEAYPGSTLQGARAGAEEVFQAAEKHAETAREAASLKAVKLRLDIEKTHRASAVHDTRPAQEVLSGARYPEAEDLLESTRKIAALSESIKSQLGGLSDVARQHIDVQTTAASLLRRARAREQDVIRLRGEEAKLKDFYKKAQRLKIPCGDREPQIFKDALADHIVNPPKELPPSLVKLTAEQQAAAEACAEEDARTVGARVGGKEELQKRRTPEGVADDAALQLPPTPTTGAGGTKEIVRGPATPLRKLAMTKACRYLLSAAGVAAAGPVFEDNGVTDETTLRQLNRSDFRRLGLTEDEITQLGCVLSGVDRTAVSPYDDRSVQRGQSVPPGPVFTSMASVKASAPRSASKPWRAPGRLNTTDADKQTTDMPSYKRLVKAASEHGLSELQVADLLYGRTRLDRFSLDPSAASAISTALAGAKAELAPAPVPVEPEPEPVPAPAPVAAEPAVITITITKGQTDKGAGIAEKDCVVTKLQSGGPAERAGVKVGMKILKVGGQAVTTSDQVKQALKAQGAQPLSFAIEVEGDAPATAAAPVAAFGMAPKPDATAAAPATFAPLSGLAKPAAGAAGTATAKSITITKGKTDKGAGIADKDCVVTKLQSGGPAERAGVKVGMKILKVGGQAVTTSDQVKQALKAQLESFALEVEGEAPAAAAAPAATPFGGGLGVAPAAAAAAPATGVSPFGPTGGFGGGAAPAFGAPAAAAAGAGTTITITKGKTDKGAGIADKDCVVTKLQSGGPAERAGVKVGMKILKVGGQAVTTSDQVKLALKAQPLSFAIEVEGGAPAAAAAPLAAFGAPQGAAPAATPFGGGLGVAPTAAAPTTGVSPFGPTGGFGGGAAPAFGAPAAAAGAGITITITKGQADKGAGIADKDCVVTKLLPGGPAERAGVKVGMKILKVGGQAVTTSDQVKLAIKAQPASFALEVAPQ